jgi:hypothetical protein
MFNEETIKLNDSNDEQNNKNTKDPKPSKVKVTKAKVLKEPPIIQTSIISAPIEVKPEEPEVTKVKKVKTTKSQVKEQATVEPIAEESKKEEEPIVKVTKVKKVKPTKSEDIPQQPITESPAIAEVPAAEVKDTIDTKTKEKKVKEPKAKKEPKPKKEPKVKAKKEPKVKEKKVKEPKTKQDPNLPNEITLTMSEINCEVVPFKKGKKNKNTVFDNDACKNEVISIKSTSKKNVLAKIVKTPENDNILEQSESDSSEDDDDNIIKQVAKKRGRKPKGGKIILQSNAGFGSKTPKPNIILHLKCFMKDLSDNVLSNSHVESFNFSSNKNDLNFDILNSTHSELINNYSNNELVNVQEEAFGLEDKEENKEDLSSDLISSQLRKREQKELWKKLKLLEHNLHMNNISDKKSCCFWDTYEFDNPAVYIPKNYIKDTYQVYGCFCSPECAVAYLMNENIDMSVKFERYHLLNLIYGKIYNYTRNVKPAPVPHYMLERFYGNLNIQEYRALLRKERIFLIVDKPLTRILPELHEDNDDFILNNKIIPSNSNQMKKKLQKNNPKNIINEQFGISTGM